MSGTAFFFFQRQVGTGGHSLMGEQRGLGALWPRMSSPQQTWLERAFIQATSAPIWPLVALRRPVTAQVARCPLKDLQVVGVMAGSRQAQLVL